MREVNVGAIVQHCSNLRSLSLRGIDRYIPSSPPSTSGPQLLHLEYLRLDTHDLPMYSPPMSNDLAVLLFASPAVVELSMAFLGELTDRVLEQASLFHGFPNLQVLTLKYCHTITKKSIDLLLTLKNPLEVLEINSCRHLKEKHYKAWKFLAQTNNWDLSIDWCDE